MFVRVRHGGSGSCDVCACWPALIDTALSSMLSIRTVLRSAHVDSLDFVGVPKQEVYSMYDASMLEIDQPVSSLLPTHWTNRSQYALPRVLREFTKFPVETASTAEIEVCLRV